MTTTATVTDWLHGIDEGAVTYLDGRFFYAGQPVSATANALLKQTVLSGWAAKSGSSIKLTADGVRELGAAR